MKKITLLSAVLVVLTVSCTKTGHPGDVGGISFFRAYNEQNATRTTLGADFKIYWTQADSISVFSLDGTNHILSEVRVSRDGLEATFSGKKAVVSPVLALCPADAGAGCDGNRIDITIPPRQMAVAGSFDPAANVAVSAVSGDELHFRNAGALLGVRIKNENITSFTIYGDESAWHRGISGPGGVTLVNGIPLAVSTSGTDSVTVQGNLENGRIYYAVVYPGTYRNLRIVFRDRYGRTATCSNNLELEARRNSAITIAEISIPEKSWRVEQRADYGWAELPAQTDCNGDGIDDNDADLYYSHTFRADAPKVRNFSACYSKGKIHPVWVAAPLHKCYLGSSGRTGGYMPDPGIHCSQSSKFTGYTRGHMIGSSDRTVSKATNAQVFYYSNIGAQLNTGFNTGGGAWNNLEDRIDGYICQDTLYQVVGCIFTAFRDKYGHTVQATTAANDAGGRFQVPTAWYKVLLRTKKGNTGKNVASCSADELQCAAFVLGHYSNASHKPCASDLYSVTELESLTGLTFFVNVPNAPKATLNTSDWGF